MRIPFPERVPLFYSTSFAFVLLIVQLLTQTDLVFSLLCFFFIITAAIAFNVAGGLTRPSGTYVFFFAMLTTIVGLVTKAVFLEPGQSRLRVPIPTMETYLAGMVAMLVAVYLSRRFSSRKGFLQNILKERDMRTAVVGCVIAGVALSTVASIVTNSQTTTVLTPIFRASNQFNRFLELAIILGVTYEIRVSGGRRSLNIPVLIAWAAMFFQGVVLGYSKEALFAPFVCWLAAAAVLGYRFKPLTVIATGLLFLFAYFYMVPYCQYGRSYRSTTNTFAQNLAVSRDLLTNLGEVRRVDAEERQNQETVVDPSQSLNYFSASHGLIDRLQMLSIDDTLHVVTDENGPLGMNTVWAYFLNSIPRVIWKNKPDILTANQYGHELGLLAPEDESTSISVSPIGESYRIAKWGGILVVAPLLWFILFVTVDSVCGDLRRSPWGILVLATFAHGANEGGLATPIYMVTFGLIGVLFVALFAAYVLPVVGSFFIPPKAKPFVGPGARAPLVR